MNKKWRLYFNKKEDYPCIWSVDEGSPASEIRVQWFMIQGLSVWATHRMSPTQPTDVEYGENDPKAWIEITGVARFQEGGVVFSGNSE